MIREYHVVLVIAVWSWQNHATAACAGVHGRSTKSTESDLQLQGQVLVMARQDAQIPQIQPASRGLTLTLPDPDPNPKPCLKS